MTAPQTGILAPVPPHARYLFFTAERSSGLRAVLKEFAAMADGAAIVAGLGQSLVGRLARTIPGLKVFPRHAGPRGQRTLNAERSAVLAARERPQ